MIFGHKSFKERTKKFWKTFDAQDTKIRELISDQSDSNKIIEKINKVVQVAFNDIPFEVGHNGEKYEFIFSPNGDKTILKQILYLLHQRPKHLDAYWNFYAAKPAMGKESMGIEIYGKKIDPEDIIIYTTLDEERKLIDLEVYIPSTDSLQEDKKYNILFLMLDLFIGELYTMEYIGSVEIIEVQKNLEHENIPLIKLRSYIDYLIEEHDWDKTKDPSSQYIGYKSEPKENSDLLRDDVYIGFSSCFDIIKQLKDEDIYPLDQLKKDGVYMGYIFYNNESISQDQLINKRIEIEDQIIDVTEKDNIAKSTGGATGLKNSYIDFIIYDFDAFLQVCKEVMSQHQFQPKGFALFNKPSKAIKF